MILCHFVLTKPSNIDQVGIPHLRTLRLREMVTDSKSIHLGAYGRSDTLLNI
jgi:hypothetical protein